MARTLSSKLALRLIPVLVGAGLCAALPPAHATTVGTLLVEPGTGDTDAETQVTFRTPVPCQDSTHARVTITGAGFPDNSPILDTIGDPTSPIAMPLGGTWNALAEALHAPTPLTGTAVVVLVCSNVDARTVDKQFSAQVHFTPTVGTTATYTAEALTTENDAAPTGPLTAPTPIPTAEPTSAPTTVQQQPSASPEPSPTPGLEIAPPTVPAAVETPSTSLTHSLIYTLSAQTQDPVVPGTPGPPPPLPGEESAGSFTMTVDSTNGGIALSTPAFAGPYLVSTGRLNPVTVRDTRTGGPGWSVSVQVSDFTSGLSGRYLGWTPFLLGPGGGAVAGADISSGYFGGNGLLEPRELATAEDGHPPGTAVLGAALDLRIPVDTAPGSYQTTLTITALS